MTPLSPDARFRQTTPAPRGVRIGGLVVALLGLSSMLATGGAAAGIVGGLVLVAAGAVVGALRIRITLDPDAVEIALVPVRRIRVPYAVIADCAVIDHLRAGAVGGIGVRRLPGGGAAILLDAGPAVSIEVADGTRYLVRSTFPREAATRIRDRAAASPVAGTDEDGDVGPADPRPGTA